VNVGPICDLVDVTMQPVGCAARAHTHLGIGQTEVGIVRGASVYLRVGRVADQR
jgi:hypothetical protein